MKRAKKKKPGKAPKRSSKPVLLEAAEIDKMRAAGRLASQLLDLVAAEIGPGVSTGEIDRLVAKATSDAGALSAPYGYRGFPAHCCTSINDVVCHGIPDDRRILEEGDIVNVDVTPIVDGYHGDSSRTFLIGEVAPRARQLVKDTWHAMWLGIRAVKPGGRIGDIGHAIQTFAEAQGYSVVREFTGHGIGREFHTAPSVLHYGRPGTGEPLVPGMTFTIEPMINLGHWKTQILEDGWTAETLDGSLSAQWEHTVLVTEAGVEVLTLGKDETPPGGAGTGG